MNKDIFNQIKSIACDQKNNIKQYNKTIETEKISFDYKIQLCNLKIKTYNDNINTLNNLSNFLKNYNSKDIEDIYLIYLDYYNKVVIKSKNLSKATNFKIKNDEDDHNYLEAHFYYKLSIDGISYEVQCDTINCLTRSFINKDKVVLNYLKFDNKKYLLNEKIKNKFYTCYKNKVLNNYRKNMDQIEFHKNSEFYEEYLKLKKLHIFK